MILGRKAQAAGAVAGAAAGATGPAGAAASGLFGGAKAFLNKNKAAKESASQAMGQADAGQWDALKVEWKKNDKELKTKPNPQRRKELEARQKEIETEMQSLEKKYTPKSEKVKGAATKVGKFFGGLGGSGGTSGGSSGGEGGTKTGITRLIWLIISALGGFLLFGGIGAIIAFGAVAALMAMAIGFRKHTKIAVPVFIIIILIGLFFWSMTPMGRQMFGSLRTTSTVASAEGLRGVAGPLNIIKQVTSGTYNPTDVWTSDNVESQYVEQKDVGVKVDDVKPLRESFLPGQDLAVQGRVSAVSLSGKDVSAVVSAQVLGDLDDAAKSILNGSIYDIKSTWSCNVQDGRGGTITGADVRNKRFICTYPAKTSAGTLGPGESKDIPVDVKVQAMNTEIRAGKQFYYTDADTFANAGDDKLGGLGISRDAVRSWQHGDDSVNLGLGLAGNEEIIETNVLTNQANQFESYYYAGVSVSNPAGHSGDAVLRLKESGDLVDNLKLFISSPYPVTIYPDAQQEDFSCFNSDGSPRMPTSDEVENYKLPQNGIVKCILKEGALAGRSNIKLAPAEARTFYVKIRIDGDKLTGPYGSFFTLATLNYDYVNKKIVTATVFNPKLGSG